MVRISDARMSGTAYGTIVLHTSPEAAVGGPLAVVRNGDRIALVGVAQAPRSAWSTSARSSDASRRGRRPRSPSAATLRSIGKASCRRPQVATSISWSGARARSAPARRARNQSKIRFYALPQRDARNPLVGGPAGAFAVPSRQAAARTLRSASRPPRRRASPRRTWHFVELARPLAAAERATLDALADLRSRGAATPPSGGTQLLVVPRPGTISPWSSKATDIARNCGLDAVARIERGVAVSRRRAATVLRRRRRSRGAAAARPRPDDRGGVRRRRAKPRACSRTSRRGRSRPSRCWPQGARARSANVELGPRARARRDRVPRGELSRARARSDRRRAHDVRAGELRALPAQDLQRRLDRRRRGAGQEPVRDDPRDAPRASARHGRRVFRQRGGDGGRDGRALLSARRRQVRRRERAHAHADEGRDAQPSDRDRAVPGRCDRLGRRDPRRRRDGPRRQAEGGARRLHGVEPAHSRLAPGVGAGLRQARPHRVGAVDHARRPDRRGVVQQRVRPSEPRRLFPHVRAGSRGRSARLSQADHDRRRHRQHPRRAHAQASARPKARCSSSWAARAC